MGLSRHPNPIDTRWVFDMLCIVQLNCYSSWHSQACLISNGSSSRPRNRTRTRKPTRQYYALLPNYLQTREQNQSRTYSTVYHMSDPAGSYMSQSIINLVMLCFMFCLIKMKCITETVAGFKFVALTIHPFDSLSTANKERIESCYLALQGKLATTTTTTTTTTNTANSK